MHKKTQKYTNFTQEEIEEYIKKVKNLVKLNRFKISDINRDKNINFINKYNLSGKKRKEMLLKLEVIDFCYAVDDYNSNDKLYVFSKEYELNNWGVYEKVQIYIKINIKKISFTEYAIIISFHEREKNISFLFK